MTNLDLIHYTTIFLICFCVIIIIIITIKAQIRKHNVLKRKKLIDSYNNELKDYKRRLNGLQ